jgi:predicted AlkP superfamily pyrophosphatase or phosphodiesterase
MSKEANIFVLIDALGWEWIKNTSFLREVAPYRARLESVLGYSTAAIPSILTGQYPQEHGRVALFRRAIGKSPFRPVEWICKLPPSLVENSYTRYAVKEFTRRINHFGGWFHLLGVPLRLLPMLDVSEKLNIYEPRGIPEVPSIFDLLKDRNVDYGVYTYHDGPNDELIARIGRDLRISEKSFFLLYLDGLDGFLHQHADKAGAVAERLKFYSDALTSVYEVAERNYGTVRMHVFGDHGMAPTNAVIDVHTRLARLNLEVPDDYFCLLDSTMARFTFFNDKARERIMSQVFSPADGGHWLEDQELRSLRSWFDDRRYGDAIYLMPEGTIIVGNSPGEIVSRGMHGFHPTAPHSASAYVSSEEPGNQLGHITQVFSLMAACI